MFTRSVWLIAACAGVATLAMGQTKKTSARDMFFAGLEAPVSAKPAAGPKAQVRPAGGVTTAAKKTELSAKNNSPAPAPAPPTRLGIRYSILKLQPQGNAEVPPATVFRSGDRIRLKVQLNDDGYLYLVHQGSSGNWQLMYPSPGSAQGSNRVVRGQEMTLPQDSVMRFNDTPGAEKLFLVVSREPQQSIEQLIFSVQAGDPKAEPLPVRQNQPGAILAMSRAINDPLISQMRRTYTRDLVLEAVNDRSPVAATAENAVYVVNTTARPDSTVVADIQLTHQ